MNAIDKPSNLPTSNGKQYSKKNPKSLKIKKERFRPDLLDLDIPLKDAYKEVRENQFNLSVVIQKLPKDINLILKYVQKGPDIRNEQHLDEKTNIIKIMDEIQKKFTILVNSKAARVVAFHRVLTNKGYRSPGIELEKTPTTNEEYLEIINWLRKTLRNPDKYIPSPLDRIYLLKTNKTKTFPDVETPNTELGDTFAKESNLRPISIPSIKDRCLQAVYLIGFNPYAEYLADEHSYAFRPGRSPAWVAHSIASHLRLSFQPDWILEVDIHKCFDSISHESLINFTPFIPKNTLIKWLKQGYILRKFENLGIFPTESGIPQGSIISPTLSNFILDGADSYIRELLNSEIIKGDITAKTAGYSRFRIDKATNKVMEKIFIFFRYADDIIIMAKSKLIAEKCKEYLSLFLSVRGLKLSKSKTHITDVGNNEAEFKFAGFLFKKKFSLVSNKTKWYIEPPEDNIKRIQHNLRQICHKKSSIGKLYHEFNLCLSSWCGFYASANSKKAFIKLNTWVFKIFYFALASRILRDKTTRPSHHKRKDKYGNAVKKKIGKKYIYKLINNKYLKRINYNHGKGNMKWYHLVRKNHRKKNFLLFSPVIFRLIKQDNQILTQKGLNYFNIEDYSQIIKINLNYKFGLRRKVLQKNLKHFQELTCPACYQPFRLLGKYELHHIQPVEFGGKTIPNNIIPICEDCHLKLTTAVNRRKMDNIFPFLSNETLKIPDEYLNQFN